MSTDARSVDPDQAARDRFDELRAALEDTRRLAERISAEIADREDGLRRVPLVADALERHIEAPLAVVDAALHLRLATPAAERLLGVGDGPGNRSLHDVLPRDVAGAVRRWLAAGASPAPGSRLTLRAGTLEVTVERVVPVVSPGATWTGSGRRSASATPQTPAAFGIVRLAVVDPDAGAR